MEEYYYWRPKPIPLPGIWPDFWVINIDIVENFIKQHKLTAASSEILSTPMDMILLQLMSGEKVEMATFPFRIPNIRGGMRIPHLHFKGEIYLLKQEQWKTFTGQVIERFKNKMATAGTVSFEKLMNLSEAVDSLA
jgi:hypothetical protein